MIDLFNNNKKGKSIGNIPIAEGSKFVILDTLYGPLIPLLRGDVAGDGVLSPLLCGIGLREPSLARRYDLPNQKNESVHCVLPVQS